MNQYRMLALGGGDEIGASCYVLQMGNNHVLLDAGIRMRTAKYSFSAFPDTGMLSGVMGLDGLHELDAVFISHAHLDHVGALPSMIGSLGSVHIYSSPATPDFISAQYEDVKNAAEFSQVFAEGSNNLSMASDHIITIRTGDTLHLKGLDATFFHAGHIPGAVMTLLEDDNRKVLYSGDFYDLDQYTVKGADIPDNIGKIDTLICEATLAYSPYTSRNMIQAEKITSAANRTGRVFIVVKSVGRAAETALAIRENIPDINIWIDQSCAAGCRMCEKYGVKVFGDRIRLLEDRRYIYAVEGVVIQSYSADTGGCEVIYENGLGLYNHAGRSGILKLIAAVNPERVIFVHGVPQRSKDSSIFDDIRDRFGSLIQAVQAQNGIEIAI